MKNYSEPYKIFLLLAAFASYSVDCYADDTEQTGWYLGGNLGQSNNKIDHDRITTGLLDGGVTTAGGLGTDSIVENNTSMAGKLFAGYQLNQYLALEGGFFDLGSLGFLAVTNPSGTLDGKLKALGGNVDVVAAYPVWDHWSAFARAGVTYNRAHADFGATGAVQLLRSGYSDNGANYKVGLGLNYAVSNSTSLRIEAERYRINDAVNGQENINLISVGLVVRFGGGAATSVATTNRPSSEPAAPSGN